MNAPLVLAFLLPAVVTGATLALVAWNRSSTRGPIAFTHSELVATPPSNDNSVRRLRFTWTEYGVGNEQVLTREKLGLLGFDVSVDPSAPGAEQHYRRLLPKQVWAVFEIGESVIQRLPPAERVMGRSRAGLVDVGRDAAQLSATYADGTTHMITAAILRAYLAQPIGGRRYVTGHLTSVEPSEIHVPREYAPKLGAPGYKVLVRYGRRFEPWIVDVLR